MDAIQQPNTELEMKTTSKHPPEMAIRHRNYLHRRMVGSTTGQLFGYYTVEGLKPGTYTLMIMASVVDDAGTTLWTRNADVVVNVDGADGDVMQLDPALE